MVEGFQHLGNMQSTLTQLNPCTLPRGSALPLCLILKLRLLGTNNYRDARDGVPKSSLEIGGIFGSGGNLGSQFNIILMVKIEQYTEEEM